MSDNAEDFVIRLQEQVSGPAQAAESALAELESRIAGGADAVREMEAQMKLLKSASEQDAGAITALSAKIGSQADALNAAQQAYVELGGSAQDAIDVAKGGAEALAEREQEIADAAAAAAQAEADAAAAAQELATAQEEAARSAGQANVDFGDLGNAADEAGEGAAGGAVNFRAMAGATRMLGGDMGGAASKGLRLVQMFSRMGPEVGAAVAGLVVLMGVIAAVAAVIWKGIDAAGQYRDEMLKLAGAMKGNVGAAKELQGAIMAVSSGSALGRDKITGYATDLAKAGLQGAEFQRALEAMAIAGSAGGDQVASALLKQMQAAKAAGGSVDALSAKMKAELGGVAAAQALSLGVQFDKLKENITALFSGADIEPLLKGIQSLLSIFSQTSETGKSLKATITGFVNAAIGAFLHAATAAVKLYIAVKSNSTAWTMLKYAAYTVLAVMVLLAAAVALVIGAIVVTAAALAAPFILAGAALQYLWDQFVKAGNAATDFFAPVKEGINSALAWLGSLSLADIGSAIINGLANGIKGAAGAVVSALTGAVSGAIDSAKALLGIHSPSELMRREIGHQMGAGVAGGVDDTAGDVADSTGSMAKGAVVAAKSEARVGAASGVATVGERAFNFINCVFGGDLTEETVRGWMQKILHEQALSAEAPT